AQAVLANLPHVETLAASEVNDATELSDVVHRPFQVSSVEDLTFLSRLGERLVVTHQDLISFHGPGYFRSFKEWWRYRELTRLTLAIADRVLFFSRSAEAEAVN